MELVNLKTGTDSYQDESGETRTRDEYPWGLCITLNNDTLNKLKAQPKGVGTEVMITAKAVIRGLSARETNDGVNRSADLQITDMAIALYGKSWSVTWKVSVKILHWWKHMAQTPIMFSALFLIR